MYCLEKLQRELAYFFDMDLRELPRVQDLLADKGYTQIRKGNDIIEIDSALRRYSGDSSSQILESQATKEAPSAPTLPTPPHTPQSLESTPKEAPNAPTLPIQKGLFDEVDSSVSYTDTKGHTHQIPADIAQQWFKTFGLKDLQEAYTPQFSEQVAKALEPILQGEQITLSANSLVKLMQRDRLEFLPYIKETLEHSDIIIKDKENALIFAKDIGQTSYFTSVSKNDKGEWVISTNSYKTLSQLKNRVSENGEVLYLSKEAPNILAETFTTKAFSNELASDIIPQATHQDYNTFNQSLKDAHDFFKANNKDPYNDKLFNDVIKVANALDIRFWYQPNAVWMGGSYTYTLNRIMLQSKDFSAENAKTILHELIHSVTSRAIYAYENKALRAKLSQEQIEAITELKNLYKEVSENNADKVWKTMATFRDEVENNKGKLYGLKNEHEMLAELANPTFREFLKEQNIFSKIVEAMAKIFSYVKDKLTGESVKSTNAQSELESILYKIMDSYTNPHAFTNEMSEHFGSRNFVDTTRYKEYIKDHKEKFDKDNYKGKHLFSFFDNSMNLYTKSALGGRENFFKTYINNAYFDEKDFDIVQKLKWQMMDPVKRPTNFMELKTEKNAHIFQDIEQAQENNIKDFVKEYYGVSYEEFNNAFNGAMKDKHFYEAKQFTYKNYEDIPSKETAFLLALKPYFTSGLYKTLSEADFNVIKDNLYRILQDENLTYRNKPINEWLAKEWVEQDVKALQESFLYKLEQPPLQATQNALESTEPKTLSPQEAKELLESKQGQRLPQELDIQSFLKSLESVENKENFIAHLQKKDDAQSRLAYLHIIEPTLKHPDLELTKGERKTKIKVFNDGENFYSFLIADLADKRLFTFLPKARKGYIETKLKNADLIQTFTSQASKDQEPNGLARQKYSTNSNALLESTMKKFNYDERKAKDLLEWHKDSSPLTKDENGVPKVFYHGTSADELFEVFSPRKDSTKWGFWFASGEDYADHYGKGKYGTRQEPLKFSTFLKVKNPFDMTDDKNLEVLKKIMGKKEYEAAAKEVDFDYDNGASKIYRILSYSPFDRYKDKARAFQNKLKKLGYDGIKEQDGVMVVFEPNQIKHIENRGVAGRYFYSSSPNIFHSNPHAGAGLLGGSVAGIEQDENGNITFNPEKFALGLLGGAVGSKAVAKGLEWRANKVAKSYPNIAKDNPTLMQKIAKRDLQTYAMRNTHNALTRFLNKNKALDITPQLFAGEKALVNEAYAPHKARLAKAKELESKGADEIEIWEKTGWYKDKDKKWKFEISQRGGEFDFSGLEFYTFSRDNRVKLSRILKDDELFTAYPSLKNLIVNFDYGMNDYKLGSYGKYTKEITLNAKQLRDNQSRLSTLYHELQHAIQDIEGFGFGYKEAENSREISQESVERYAKQHGEVEARNVQKRLNSYGNIHSKQSLKDEIQKLKDVRLSLQKSDPDLAEVSDRRIKEYEKNYTNLGEYDIYNTRGHPHKTMDIPLENTIAESTIQGEALSKELTNKVKNMLESSNKILGETMTLKDRLLIDNKIKYSYLKEIAQDLPKPITKDDFLHLLKNKKYVNIQTPIKELEIEPFKAYEHLTQNSNKQNRIDISGAILPTLQNPLFITKDKKDTYYFYKPFKDEKGVLNIVSIAIPKSNRIRYKTSYIASRERMLKMINEYELVYEAF